MAKKKAKGGGEGGSTPQKGTQVPELLNVGLQTDSVLTDISDPVPFETSVPEVDTQNFSEKLKLDLHSLSDWEVAKEVPVATQENFHGETEVSPWRTTVKLSKEEKEFCLNLLSLFKIDGKPGNEMVTEGQLLLFGALVLRKGNRLNIITSTQYGKSLFVALACLVLSCIEGEMISIPAPSEDKARIIMRYYLQHLGDHPIFYSQLEKGVLLDRLLMETTKDRLVLKNRGGVFILSVQAKNSNKGFEAAMGEGSKIVIQDESSLIPDGIESTIFRMIAGKKDAMYVKIGNPFYRNHFYKSAIDPRYEKIFIDFKQGLKEGRYNYDFIEEARTKPNFDILYACQFPPEGTIGKDGYTRLLTDREVENSVVPQGIHSGYKILGIDPAAGGDNSAIVLKSGQYIEILFNQQLTNTMDLVGVAMDLYRSKGADYIVVDKTGVGQGVYDRLQDGGYPMRGVSFGEKSEDDMFQNLKAEWHWRLREWLLKGGRLIQNPGWYELRNIKYKNRDGKIMIQPKEELFKEGIASPNCVDAAVLTMVIADLTIRNDRMFRRHGHQFKDAMSDIWRA